MYKTNDNFVFIIYSLITTLFLSFSCEARTEKLEDWQTLCQHAPAVCNPSPEGSCDESSDCYGALPTECTKYAAETDYVIYFRNDCFNLGCGISCQPTSTLPAIKK